MTQVVKVEHSNPDHHKWFVVNWCMGNTCNYSCSYCPEGLHDGTHRWPELKTVTNLISDMKAHAATLEKSLYIELTGGEVTLWKHFLEVAEFCRDQDVKLGFISNGSRTLRWWEENRHLFDHVCLSFHPEAKEDEHFIKVVKLLSRQCRTHVNIMMDPVNFSYCYAVAVRVRNVDNISMALQPLIHDFGDKVYDYNDSQKRIFDMQHELLVKHIKWEKTFPYYRGAMRATSDNGTAEVKAAHRFIAQKQNNWFGWDCYAGVEQIIIDMDGTIHRGWCKVGGNLGTIHAPRFTDAPVVCDKIMCHCNYDIMSTKVRRSDAPKVIPITPVA